MAIPIGACFLWQVTPCSLVYRNCRKTCFFLRDRRVSIVGKWNVTYGAVYGGQGVAEIVSL